MRMLMFVKLPVEPFNTMVRNGTAGSTMKRILDKTKPEAAYFTTMDGRRGGVMAVNMEHANDMVRLAEPWFLALNASVTFEPAMTPARSGRGESRRYGQAVVLRRQPSAFSRQPSAERPVRCGWRPSRIRLGP